MADYYDGGGKVKRIACAKCGRLVFLFKALESLQETLCRICRGADNSMFARFFESEEHLVAVPPHPWVSAVAAENLDFERAMISLASCVPCDPQSLTDAFKKFAASLPWPWREAVSYCRRYFVERGRFPFEIEEWPEVIGE